jgi:dephospho-CoA kinase
MAACFVLGLLGGVGSGKSTAAALLAEQGARVLDADAMCTELLHEPDVRAAIEQRWGGRAFGPDGALDRDAMADRIFADPAERRALEAILHPRVVERITRAVERCRTDDSCELCVIDAPLLLESGLIDLCDATVFLDCEEPERYARLARDRGWTADEAGRREAAQAPLAEKRARADATIVNRGDRAAIRNQLLEMIQRLEPSGVQTDA